MGRKSCQLYSLKENTRMLRFVAIVALLGSASAITLLEPTFARPSLDAALTEDIQADTSSSKASQADLRREFDDADRSNPSHTADGKLTLEECESWIGSKLDEKSITDFFAAADQDHDGFLNWSEYLAQALVKEGRGDEGSGDLDDIPEDKDSAAGIS